MLAYEKSQRPQSTVVRMRSSSILKRFSTREQSPQVPPKDPQYQRHSTQQPMYYAPNHIASHMSHTQRVDVPSSRSSSTSTSTSTSSRSRSRSPRVQASEVKVQPFPNSSHVQTVTWDVFLDPDQIHSLVMGARPQHIEDKWIIYAEGPDQSGKMKIHFHRSWTGLKIAELFIVIDLKGEGAGKIVGIKWNGTEQTNRMDEEEAKYMVATTCQSVLGVDMQNGIL